MITDSFDNKTDTLINLEDFYGPKKNLIDKCLIIFSHQIYEHILSKFQCEKIAEIHWANGIFPIYKFNSDGLEIAFYLSAIGSMGASQYLIEVAWVTGATKFIMFGSAGCLNDEATKGKYVIPTEAYRDEGMSYHYAPPSDFITVQNADKLAGIFDKLDIPYVKGRIWTTDAFLRETICQIKLRKAEGCLAVEEEVAGVQSVCNFHGYELFDFLQTGDVLSETDYKNEGLAEANHDFDKLYIAIKVAKLI